MAYIFADRVLETSTSTGTGVFTLAGAVTGYRAFSAVCATSDTVSYVIEGIDASGAPSGEWETGVGTYSGVNTLTRTTVTASSNAGSAVVFSAGTKRVFITQTYGAPVLLGRQLFLPASTTTEASLNIGNGTAPTSPANGDIWMLSTGFFVRLGGTSHTVALATGTQTISGAWTFSATNLNLGGNTSTGTIQLAYGATSSGGTKTVNIATGGVSGSTTTVTIGSTTGTSVTANGAWTFASQITGSISGTASNVTGTVAVGNGGTGATTLTGLLVGNGTSAFTAVTAPSGTVVGTSDTQTLTNKRVNPRIGTVTSSATVTPTADTADQYTVTALAVAAAIAAPSGTPVDGQKLMLRIKDNGTARGLSWTTSAGGYRVIGTTLPTTTVISKTLYIGCIYNSADGFWDVVAVAQEA